MRRKLVQHGESTLMVSLPAKWIQKHSLTKGDEIFIKEEPTTLTLSGKPQDLKLRHTVDLNKDNILYLRSAIGALYRNGYDEIKIIYKDDIRNKIQLALASIFSLEIIEEKDKYCTIKNIGNDSPEITKMILKKLIFIIKSIIIQINEDNGNYTNRQTIENLRINQYQYRDYCLRLICKNKSLKEKNESAYTFIVTLDKIGSQFRKIYFLLSDQKLKMSKLEIEYFKKISHYYDIITKSFINRNLKDNHVLMDLRGEVFENQFREMAKTSKNPMLISHYYCIATLMSGLHGVLIQLNN